MRHSLRKVLAVLDGKPTGMKGQSLVEMAFTAPILILMILGIAEVGFLANSVLTLLDVAREASRRAVTLDPRVWNEKNDITPARWGERLDCDTRPNQYALALGSPPDPARVGAGSGRHTQFAAELGYLQGVESQANEFGFFDGVACYALSIMDPLTFNDHPTEGKDDVVVSAISYALMNYTGDPDVTGYIPGDIAAPRNALIAANSQNAYWVTVTGRWPLENRFCTGNSNPTMNDERDPFDYLRTNNLNVVRSHAFVPGSLPIPIQDTVTDGVPRQLNELAETDLATGQLLEPQKYVLSAAQSQGVRGYTFTGKLRNEGTTGCYGSKWTVQAIEQKLNYDLFPPAKQDFRTDLQQKFTNGGIVLVEIQWQYSPFFLGRIINFGDFLLYVYSVFPVSTIEPTATP